ncbi:BadF/BadG/BcrA/BcrD ATPase family protein [Alteromonas ponticola]|uniref:ATPase BadF/BadG/BcrA/BcrD type domain-containing protein n=1 Tax=Alteromonas ponticola TaxID=2720613 RepID=A0ABX1R2Z0_9ALTE|nr:BadF/BadG/BcrA/BcrD ATPase family protein [Alteromonas ponticola]NMH60143.1 hypothetical protein [Alteromonas ponticola]
MPQFHTYYVGIDGGGTRCRATLFDQAGKCLGVAEAGGANVAMNARQAQRSILNAIEQALTRAGLQNQVKLSQLRVAAGLAGANVASARLLLTEWAHPFASFLFTSDLFSTIIGAHAGKEGALLIVGTGSCAASWQNGELKQYGGHGFALGDKGSGAWLGKQAIAHTLEVLDGVTPQSDLAQLFCEHLQLHSADLLVERFHKASSAQFGELAPWVFDAASANDSVAIAIIKDGAAYLSTIARLALTANSGKLSITGGVAAAITPYLQENVRNALVPVAHGPEWGAVHLFYRDHCRLP